MKSKHEVIVCVKAAYYERGTTLLRKKTLRCCLVAPNFFIDPPLFVSYPLIL